MFNRSLHATILCATVALFVPGISVAQQTGTRHNPVEREPLMRASIAVELIPSANAEETETASDSLVQQEEELKKMEAELLKALDGSANEEVKKDSGHKNAIANISAPSQDAPKKEAAAKQVNQEEKSYPVSSAQESTVAKSLHALEQHPALSAPRGTTSAKQAAAKTASPKTARAVPTNLTLSGTDDMSQKLAIAESQVKILSRELDLSRRSLSSAEERIDELASIVRASRPIQVGPSAQSEIPSGTRGSMGNKALTATDKEGDFAIAGPSRKGSVVPPISAPGAVIDYRDYDSSLRDSSVATVVSDRAPLRVAPGKQESAIFVLPRLSEVGIEYRSGEWYRIVTQSGLRGWIYGSALQFEAGVSPVSAVRVGGVRALYEPVSFR